MAIGGMLTMAIGAIAAAIALIAALWLPLQPNDSRSHRVGRFVAGPLACAVVGSLIAYFTEMGVPSQENEHRVQVLDDLWFLYPILGVVVGACVFLAVGRKKRIGRA
jgi:cytochrome bd-type quinol oxidase subunit 2